MDESRTIQRVKKSLMKSVAVEAEAGTETVGLGAGLLTGHMLRALDLAYDSMRQFPTV